MQQIRNFCIIAHIDHGKSTLADRMLEITGTIAKRDMKHAQTLDSMDIEQERGITIKLTPVRMNWKGVQLNLIDTPGHVDFQYEVSRSLASVEGAILVVDATQGIEAQTLSNVYLALENDLEIIPVLNKIDLPSADPERVGNEIISLLGCKREEIISVSAKTGENIESLLDAIIERFPLPRKLDKESNIIENFSVIMNDSETTQKTSLRHSELQGELNSFQDRDHLGGVLESSKIDPEINSGGRGNDTAIQKTLIRHSELVSESRGENNSAGKIIKALIFDSQYDPYKGVVVYVKLFSGNIKRWDKLEFLNTGAKMEVNEVGFFAPKYNPSETLGEGEIGYIVTGLKSISDAKVGDTIFGGTDLTYKNPIKGFKQITPFIFAGIYPVDNDEYNKLKDAIEKLQMNDSSLQIEHEASPALGYGFRCGFLGLLHLDIVKERLWREFEMDVIITSPQVTYKVLVAGDKIEQYRRFKPELTTFQEKTATQITISNPEDLPKPGTFIQIDEPIAKLEIITPTEFTGNMMQLAQDRRGIFINQHYLDSSRVVLVYEIPIAEIVGDFYDDLKSMSSGYASMSYEFIKYKTDEIVKVDILVAGERLEALSMMVHKNRARAIGGNICRKLKDNIPKAQFAIAVQAAIGAQVIAREDISALRKDVTAKLYGGDVSRKRKVLDKQKEGKKKMKQFGRVSIPSETFVNILKKD